MKKIVFLIFAFVMAFTIVYAKDEKIPVKYIKTSDGDTARFEVDGENVRVRFLGINTPEVAGEDKVEEPYGNEALEYTKKKLDNAKVIEIEYDDNADTEDRFGRKLAYIWVDGELFQEELLKNGYAKTYMMKANYKYADELKAAEREAKSKKLGVWSDEIIDEFKNDSINGIQQNDETQDNHEENLQVTGGEESHIITFVVIIIVIGLLSVFFKMKNDNK